MKYHIADRVVAFDPGGTTGYAVVQLVQTTPTRWRVLEAGAFPQFDEVETILMRHHPRTVLYETLHVTRPGVRTVGAEVIGAIRYLARFHNMHCLERSPALLQGIRRWPIRIEYPVRGPHALDALHHAIVYVGPGYVEGVTFTE